MFKERIIQQLALYESVQDVNGFLTATPPLRVLSQDVPKMGPDDFGTATYAQMMLT